MKEDQKEEKMKEERRKEGERIKERGGEIRRKINIFNKEVSSEEGRKGGYEEE